MRDDLRRPGALAMRVILPLPLSVPGPVVEQSWLAEGGQTIPLVNLHPAPSPSSRGRF